MDDHRLVAEGISSLLSDADFRDAINREQTIVDTAYSVQHATDLLKRDQPYELIMLDLSMPQMDGFDLLTFARDRGITVPMIVLSASDQLADIRHAYDLGASGYVCKFEPSNEMLRKIIDVAAGKKSFPDQIFLEPVPAPDNMPDEKAGALTPRQHEVLAHIAAGKSNKQIATLLDVSLGTVKFHVSEVFRQLGVRNRTACIREATQRGLIRYESRD